MSARGTQWFMLGLRQKMLTLRDNEVLLGLLLQLQHERGLPEDISRDILRSNLGPLQLAHELREQGMRVRAGYCILNLHPTLPTPEPGEGAMWHFSTQPRRGYLQWVITSKWLDEGGQPLRFVVSVCLADVTVDIPRHLDWPQLSVDRVHVETDALGKEGLDEAFLRTVGALRLQATFNSGGGAIIVRDATGDFDFTVHLDFDEDSDLEDEADEEDAQACVL
jgi:hypothetical protein